MAEEEYLKEQLEKADKFIRQLEYDCSLLVDGIVDTVCKNVIKRIDEEMKQFSLCDDLSKDFTFFEQLSILHQSRDYDEIFFPKGQLEDYIENTIELELDKLSNKDKIILWYSECHSKFGNDYEVFNATDICIKRFNDFENKTYEALVPKLEQYDF